ncbi:MAG: hypothetical protein FJ039_04410 [Chloroflexi bacterium]|nr:hypothetical protein [Chloroflexota bacterium]
MESTLYLQEIVKVTPGKWDAYVAAMEKRGVAATERAGLKLVGAWQVQLALREALLIWKVESPDAFSDEGWLLRAPKAQPKGGAWSRELATLVEDVEGKLMSPVPVSPAPQPGVVRGAKRRRLFFHETMQVNAGKLIEYLEALKVEAIPKWDAAGWRVEGIFLNHMKPRELLWYVSNESGRKGLFEPSSWMKPGRPLPEQGEWDWMRKGWQWRQEWQDRMLLPLGFSPLR